MVKTVYEKKEGLTDFYELQKVLEYKIDKANPFEETEQAAPSSVNIIGLDHRFGQWCVASKMVERTD